MKDGMKVVRADQSPMNPSRWCIELECGHEIWVTAARKPSAKTKKCPHGCRPLRPEER